MLFVNLHSIVFTLYYYYLQGDSLNILQERLSPNVFLVVQLLATKPMQLAKYFCTGDLPVEQWHHYALNVSNYTHFTSPIRRYPDIIVHRLLEGAIMLDNCNSNNSNIRDDSALKNYL